MDLMLASEDIAFRDEVRRFLAGNLPAALTEAERLNPSFLSEPKIGHAWQHILHEKGWAAPAWPKEFGGTGWTLTQRYIFDQECELAGEPHFRGPGMKMLAPVLMRFGTEAQKSRYLPRILSGEDTWAQGYSEPDAGSDLASLKTKAARDGDDYVINGSKIWTTHAHAANRMFALVRNADTGKRQEGISFILFDMATPGVTVRPILSICGTHEFNQVFFDNVRVPAENLVGAEGAGWDIAKYLLAFERGGTFAGGSLRAAYRRLFELASKPAADGSLPLDEPTFAASFAELGADLDAYEVMELGMLSKMTLANEKPGAAASSIMKVQRTRLRQAITELAATLVGYGGLAWSTEAEPEDDLLDVERRVLALSYFNARGQSVFGGSNEIQLEIIAGQILR